MIMPDEQRVYDVLAELGIEYARYEHPPLATVEAAEPYWADIPATHCKNLFLRNQKGNAHYLVILTSSKKADLRSLTRLLDEDRLSFASPERLMKHLGLTPGSVSPFGLIHDRDRAVRVVLDEDLAQADRVTFHPNVNTATLSVRFQDFERFLGWTGHRARYVKFA